MTEAFLEEITLDKQDDMPEAKPFYAKPIYWLAIVLSLLWVWAAIDYIVSVEWWSERYHFSPAEFIGLVCSQLLPLAIIWSVVFWVERKDQLEEESRTLRSYMKQLMYPTEQGVVYTQTLTNALRAQIQEFRVVFSEAANQTNTVRDEMKRWIKDLAIVIDHVDTKTVGSMKELANHVQTLVQSTEQANQSTTTVTQSLAERAQILDATSQKVGQMMADTSALLQEDIARIDGVTDGLRQAAQHTGEILQIADKTSTTFGQQMDRMESLISQYEMQTSSQNARILENAEKILTVLKTQGALLDQEVDKTLHKMSTVSETVGEQTRQLQDASDAAITRVNDVGTQLGLQTDMLNQVLGETDERVRQLAAVSVEEQTKKLMDVSQKADDFINRLKSELQSASTDRFMKDARLILEHLASFSIDIVHVFTPKAEEEQWKKYYAGDNAAFMRYLMTALPKDKSDAFKRLYQENPTLRVAVTRYMSEFDALAMKAKNNEKKDVLLPVLIGSDAGRLYMLLKQTLGKSTKGGV